MSALLQDITQNYLDPDWDNTTLVATLEDLDDAQLGIVIYHIKDVQEKYGDCKLRRVTNDNGYISVMTYHRSDPGATYNPNTYK